MKAPFQRQPKGSRPGSTVDRSLSGVWRVHSPRGPVERQPRSESVLVDLPASPHDDASLTGVNARALHATHARAYIQFRTALQTGSGSVMQRAAMVVYKAAILGTLRRFSRRARAGG